MSKSLRKYGCVCGCMSLCIFAAALFGFYIGAGRYLRVPSFKVLEFELAGLDESLETSRVNTESTFTIETRNRGKKMHIYYKDFTISVQWKTVNLGHGRVAGFDYGRNNISYIRASLRSSPDHMKLDFSEQAQLTDARNRGRMMVSVEIDVRTQWKDMSGLKSDYFDVKIDCKVTINPQIHTASQLLDQDCRVLDFHCLEGC